MEAVRQFLDSDPAPPSTTAKGAGAAAAPIPGVLAVGAGAQPKKITTKDEEIVGINGPDPFKQTIGQPPAEDDGDKFMTMEHKPKDPIRAIVLQRKAQQKQIMEKKIQLQKRDFKATQQHYEEKNRDVDHQLMSIRHEVDDLRGQVRDLREIDRQYILNAFVNAGFHRSEALGFLRMSLDGAFQEVSRVGHRERKARAIYIQYAYCKCTVYGVRGAATGVGAQSPLPPPPRKSGSCKFCF